MISKACITVAVTVSVYWLLPSVDHFQPEELVGKNVVVTGASIGIGEQIAYHYASMGANVFITARREELLKQVIRKCKELGRGGGAIFGYVAADMAQMTETNKVIKKAVDTLGGIDHLVLNHAWFTGIDFWKGTEDNLTMIQQRMDVNFFSFVHLFSHASTHLQKSQKPAIAAVASSAGRLPSPFMSAYAASKFALDGFFTSVKEELRLKKCNTTLTMCILGAIDTEHGAVTQKEFFTALGYDYDAVKSMLPAASPGETALAIVRATTLGEAQLYYPPSNHLQFFVLFNHLFPEHIFKFGETILQSK